jgi:hypothetical protein
LSKLLIIFLEAFGDLFVAAAEAAFQSSPGTKANLHKVEAVEEGLLLGELAEYTASSTHDASIETIASNPSKAHIFAKEHLPRD